MIKSTEILPLEVGRPYKKSDPSGPAEFLQIFTRVPTAAIPALLKASGRNGVFSRPFTPRDAEAPNQYRVIPLPDVRTLTEAHARAAAVAENFGLVCTRKGLAVRVLNDHFEATATKLHGSEGAKNLIGDLYEV